MNPFKHPNEVADDKLREDMSEKGLVENQVADKNNWKRLARNSDPI